MNGDMWLNYDSRDFVGGRNWLRLTSALTRSIFDADVISDMPFVCDVIKLKATRVYLIRPRSFVRFVVRDDPKIVRE